MTKYSTYTELSRAYLKMFYAEAKNHQDEMFFDSAVEKTPEARMIARFEYWMHKTADGRRCGHRDRMYHADDWGKEVGAFREDFVWVASEEAKERMYQDFLIYDRNKVAVAV